MLRTCLGIFDSLIGANQNGYFVILNKSVMFYTFEKIRTFSKIIRNE